MKQESQKSQINEKLIRSYGRIKSRKLSNHKNSLLDKNYKEYEFLLVPNFNEDKEVILEIGFGFGDFLFEKAKSNSDCFFIGAEPHLNGIVNILSKLESSPLQNIKLTTKDARILLESIADESLKEIYILFPDPWPKSKHFKRRIINEKFLNLIANKLKKNGSLTIATDHDSYKTHILSMILQNKRLIWQANSKSDWENFPKDWIVTKYQKKAENEGRQSIYLLIKKC